MTYDGNNYIDILGVKVSAVNLELASNKIEEWIFRRIKTYVCVAPVSTIVDSQNDSGYKNIINSSGMTTPDGMPVVWIGKLKGNKNIERTYGPDLMLRMIEISAKKGFRNYLYGGTEATNNLLVQSLKKRFPSINIVGSYAPPFRKIHELEDQSIISQINTANPDILWVGLGSPKQDFWMHEHRDKLDVPVIVGSGAAFDFLAGTKPQAPKWMQRSGLEWLFRLCCEPGRLWKRYLVGNTKFIYWLIKDSLGFSNGSK